MGDNLLLFGYLDSVCLAGISELGFSFFGNYDSLEQPTLWIVVSESSVVGETLLSVSGRYFVTKSGKQCEYTVLSSNCGRKG